MDQPLTNENLTISVERLGVSGEPLLIIDDFLAKPEKLVANTSASTAWREAPRGGYPGLRAALPADYARQTLRRLDPIIKSRIFKTACSLDRFDCSFSLVTRTPDELQEAQKIPHIDVASETRVAILHYLCPAHFGGTAFFRQDRTGLEQITSKDREAYLTARKHDLTAIPQQAGFPDGNTAGYTQTGHVEAQFNRLVIYRSCTLHSGIINAPDKLTTAPAQGRLTANFFVDYSMT